MKAIRLIDIKECILADFMNLEDEIRLRPRD